MKHLLYITFLLLSGTMNAQSDALAVEKERIIRIDEVASDTEDEKVISIVFSKEIFQKKMRQSKDKIKDFFIHQKAFFQEWKKVRREKRTDTTTE